MEGKIIKQINFSGNNIAETIIKELADLTHAAVYSEYGAHGIIDEFTIPNYREKNEKIKSAILSFASNSIGIKTPTTPTELAFAFDNITFRSIINTITARTLATVMVTSRSPQLDRLASFETVGVGGSKSYEIETKMLPMPQRGTYGNNVTLVPTYAKSSVVCRPKQYTTGISLDYINILAVGYDFGRALARIYAGNIFAQYKLIVSKLFDTTLFANSPFYQANWSPASYVQMAEDIGMLSGGGIDNVTAFGTRSAWQAITALATQGGFVVKDEYIRTGFLQKMYSIDSMILDQFTNLAAPFTTANAPSLRAIPNDVILLAPNTSGGIAKVVREDYVKVIETPAIENNDNRTEYTFMNAFECVLATPDQFGQQRTNA